MVTLTLELLCAGAGPTGCLNREQVLALGEPWPLKAGWWRRLLGKVVPDANYRRFLELAGRSKAQRKRARDANQPPLFGGFE